jgi:hypothetical protein
VNIVRNIPALIALAVLPVFMSNEVAAETSCGIETLTGTYIISASGTEGGNFSAYSGMIAYDGKGKVRVRIRYGGPSQETKEVYGKQALVGPCEIEAVSQSGRSAHYFIDPSGDRFRYVMTSGGSVAGDGQRISKGSLFE